MADRIPEPIRVRLGPIAASLARGADTAVPDIFGGRSIAGEAARLAVTLNALSDDEAAEKLVGLLGGESADRLMAATLARHVAGVPQITGTRGSFWALNPSVSGRCGSQRPRNL
jgi:hypothetical protein